MTVQRFPSAIYHCNVPLKAVYESSSDVRKGSSTVSNSPPIPTWPDIQNPNRWCCLPSLKRAIFVCNQERNFEIAALQELLSLVSDDPKTTERKIDRIITSVEKGISFIHRLSTAWSQTGSGEKDAFSLLHELIHYYVGLTGMYSAFRQSTQADKIHSILETITTAPQLSSRDLQQLWNGFFNLNSRLLQSVQKFAMVEETIANYSALIFAAPYVRDDVSNELLKAIEKEGYTFFFNLFIRLCGNEFLQLFVLMELFTIYLDNAEIVPEEYTKDGITWLVPLAKASTALKDVGKGNSSPSLDDVDRWVSSNFPTLEPAISNLLDFRCESQTYPVIILRGAGSSAHVEVRATSKTSISEVAVKEECFWESLRQQISKVCGLTCPYKFDSMPCCGRENLMWNLWNRIPQGYRRALKRPTCGTRT